MKKNECVRNVLYLLGVRLRVGYVFIYLTVAARIGFEMRLMEDVMESLCMQSQREKCMDTHNESNGSFLTCILGGMAKRMRRK